MMDAKIKAASITTLLIEEMRQMTDEDREAIFQELLSHFCEHCGGEKDPSDVIGCQCWNDE